MVTGKNLVYILTAIALITATYFFLFPDKEKQIKKQLHRLTEYATKQQDEPTLTSLKKSKQIGALFADTGILKIRTPEIEGNFSRKELTDRITLARNAFTSLNLSFYDVNIQFSTETVAEVLLTMRLLGRMGADDIADVQEVRIVIQKQEGKWLFTGVEIVEVLEK